MNKSRRQLFLGIVVAAASLGLALVGVVAGSGSPATGRDSARFISFEHQQLEETLQELRRTWNPASRARVVEASRKRIGKLELPLQWVLSRPNHPRLAEAMYLAAELGLQSTRKQIASLARAGPMRPQAIRAASKLEAWSTEELSAFLGSSEPEVLLAVLELSAKRARRPLAGILSLLGHPDARVRESALEAVPVELPETQLMTLAGKAEKASGPAVAFILRAIGKTHAAARCEAILIERLASSDNRVRMAALDALATKSARLARPEPVWELCLDYSEDRNLRAQAMLCLERTRSFSIERLRAELPSLPPFLDYFAARCLITAGEKDGVQVLLSLLDENEPGLRAAARELLAELAGTGPYVRDEVWSVWYENLASLPARKLPDPPFDLEAP